MTIANAAETPPTGASSQSSGVNKRRSSQAQRIAGLTAANERLRLITQISDFVIGSSTLAEQVSQLARQIREAFPADACVVRVLEGEDLHMLACDGIPAEYLTPQIKVGLGIAGEIIASRRPLVIQDVSQHPITMNAIHSLPNSYEFFSYAGTPLMVEDQVVGILGLFARQPNAFTETDGEHLQVIAYHIAVAIANDRLYSRMTQQKEQLEQQVAERLRAEQALRLSMEHLQQSLEGTVRAMSSVVEMRDPYTAGHQRRVSALTCAMAAQMQIPTGQIETLRIAGLLHDIGKIAVPAQILCKPTRLLPPEWNIIQTHAQVGYAILKDTALPGEVATVALQHHERMDGSGYPNGLRGDEIIQAAQILAVADVVEAMVSDRPYRPGLPIEEALAEITRHRGTRYLAEAVDACMEALAQHEYDMEVLIAQWERPSAWAVFET